MALGDSLCQWSPARRYTLAALASLALLLLFWLALRTPGHPDLPDMRAIADVDERKRAFYSFLLPAVRDANATIRRDRERLQSLATALADGEAPSWWSRRWLAALCKEYGLEYRPERLRALTGTLLRRVDVIPPELALAQAAKESGWGRSRFAREANNLYGQWCYTEGCGLVPARRKANAAHEVRAFDSIADSIRAYMHNLNTHRRYRQFRDLRAALRERGQPITGPAVSAGLVNYSQRREAYVEEVLAMMQQNAALFDAVADT